MSSSPVLLRLCLIASLLIWAVPSWSQSSVPSNQSNLNSTLLSAKIKEVEATTDIDETLKNTLIESYRRSQSQLEAANSNRETAARFAEQLENAPSRTAEIREFLESVKNKPETLDAFSSDTPTAEVQGMLVKEKANLAAVEAKLTEIEQQLTREKTRPKEARERLTTASSRIKEIADALRIKAPEKQNPRLEEAQAWGFEAESMALNEEIKMLDQELLSGQVRIDLLKAERDRALRSIERMGNAISKLEEINSEQRQQEALVAQEEAEAAKIETSGKHPLLQELAQNNDLISKDLQLITADLEQAKIDRKDAETEISKYEEEFKSSKLKLNIGGLSQALGQVLHEQRRSLPDVSSYLAATKQREQLIAKAGLNLINLQEQRAQLRDSDIHAKSLGAAIDPMIYVEIHDDLVGLIDKQAELLDSTIKLDEEYIRTLGELEFTQRKLTAVISEYRSYLDQRLMWIRTSPNPSIDTVKAVPGELQKLFISDGWLYSWKVLVSGLAESVFYVLGIAIAGLLLWRSSWLKEQVDTINDDVASGKNTAISQTFKALVMVILRAAPWPLLLWVMGLRLAQESEGHLLARSLSDACHWASIPLFYLTAFRVVSRPHGLASVHFNWPEPLVAELSKALYKLTLVLIPVGFVAVLLVFYPPIGMSGTLGRIGLVVLMVSVMLFFLNLFGPRSTILPHLAAFNPESKVVTRQYLWFLLALIVPSMIVYLAITGYAYTAGFLLGRLIDSALMVLVVIVLHQVFIRWLGLVQDKLPDMLDRIPITERYNPTDAHDELNTVDIDMLTSNSRTLINTLVGVSAIIGLWLIWSDVLPALSILNEIALWSYSETVDNQLTKIPVTLADLGLAILVTTITIIATRSLPALLEIILIQLIRMPSGDRYTTLTLLRYFIVAVGLLWAANIVGARWDQIQWLAAGLTVGIGFGLQEIVANFISGLIILFERPIRVGDKVTVGETMGIVTKIQIRATTVQTWDRQELLVPNKEFITSRLLNWTLSDQTSRIVFNAEVVHGTDTEQAMALMLEAANEHPKILKDPEAFATMEGFTDNALKLIMRAYVGSFDDRLGALSSIYQNIDAKFKQAGITIAFERRDLHFADEGALNVKINTEENDNP